MKGQHTLPVFSIVGQVRKAYIMGVDEGCHGKEWRLPLLLHEIDAGRWQEVTAIPVILVVSSVLGGQGVTHVDLAAVEGVIPGPFHDFAQRILVHFSGQLLDTHARTIVVRAKAARHDACGHACPARDTHRIGTVCSLESNTVLRQAVHGRSLEPFVTRTAHHPGVLLVCHDEQDIGLPGLLRQHSCRASRIKGYADAHGDSEPIEFTSIHMILRAQRFGSMAPPHRRRCRARRWHVNCTPGKHTMSVCGVLYVLTRTKCKLQLVTLPSLCRKPVLTSGARYEVLCTH